MYIYIYICAQTHISHGWREAKGGGVRERFTHTLNRVRVGEATRQNRDHLNADLACKRGILVFAGGTNGCKESWTC
jgi:hypothetical protein